MQAELASACGMLVGWVKQRKQRPNQALSCGNRPPLTTFQSLPSLPAAQAQIDTDHWLKSSDGWRVVHAVNARELVSVDLHPYSISYNLADQAVALRVDAAQQALVVLQHEQPLKSLYHQLCSFDDSVQRMADEARAQQWPLAWQKRLRWLVSSNSP
jgi:hypothetical protein